MNAEKLIEELWKVYEYYFCSTVVHPSGLNVRMMAKNCADKLEEMKDELAKEKRRAEKALGYIKKIFGCDECVHDDDDTNYETCKSCNIYDKWQWRGDAEDGE